MVYKLCRRVVSTVPRVVEMRGLKFYATARNINAGDGATERRTP